jgi:hypothetical protein
MIKMETKPLSLTYPAASSAQPDHVRRLIVLFPASTLDDPNQAHRIWEIARSFQLSVLLLSLCTNPGEESQLRRKLVTLAAAIKDGEVGAGIMIRRSEDWVAQVREIWQPGDAIACYAGHRVGLARRPLEQVLRPILDEAQGPNSESAVYILSDARLSKESFSRLFAQAFVWLGSLGILAGFFWIEAKLIQLPQDWGHTALLYVCLFVEVGLIWAWNSIFG